MKTFTFKTYLLVFSLVVLTHNVFCQDNSDIDDRMKIRLGFTSVNNLHRQILVTVDSEATPEIDFGYDAENFENHIDDMYWMIDNRKFLIQGTNVIDQTTILPLGLHTGANGDNMISIEGLVNVPDDLAIGILDKDTNTYYNIKQTSGVSIFLPAGEYLNRFELVFLNNNGDNSNNDDSIDDDEEIATDIDYDVDVVDADFEFNYINKIKCISIKNIGMQTIKSVQVYNINGQLLTKYDNINTIDDSALIQTYNLNAGNYILVVNTKLGILSKKISVR